MKTSFEFEKFLILKGLSRTSITTYIQDLGQFYRIAGNFESSRENIQKFVLFFSTAKPSTRKRKIAFLKHLVGFWNNGMSLENIKAPKVPFEIPHVPSDVEIKQILAKCQEPSKASTAIRLLTSTGCRIGSLVNINIEDIQKNQITLRQVKGGGSYIATMDQKTKELLQQFIGGRRKGPLFLNPQKQRISSEGLRYSMKKHLGSLYSNPHSFRHWICTKLLEKGMDLFSLQKFMNHSSITATQKYVHISQKNLNNQISKKHPLFSTSQ